MGAIKGQVDLALTSMAGSMRVEQGAGIDRILRLCRDQLGLVVSLDDVDKVKAAKGETSGCVDELRRLAGAGRIGEKILGKAYRQLNVHIFQKNVLGIVQGLTTEEGINTDQVRDVERRAMDMAARVAGDFAEATLPTSLDYLGVPLEVKAKTSQHYVRLAIASVLKAAMVGKERGLVALPWEKELVTTCRQQCKVANEIVEKHKLAKGADIEMVRDAGTPEEMLDVIKANNAFCTSWTTPSSSSSSCWRKCWEIGAARRC